MNRRPYDPARDGPQSANPRDFKISKTVHDRRARIINRQAHVVEVEIDDPYEAGAKISAVRSVRDDPLADQLARGHIDEAQFLAGRQFQHDFGIAERGPRAMALTEAVDGSPLHETLTDGQLRASDALSRCYGALGKDGSALAHDVLIRSMTLKQVSVARGMPGREWERYLGRRIGEVLNCLAEVYGYSTGARGGRV